MTLPIVQGSVDAKRGANKASYVIQQEVDPAEALQGFSAKIRGRLIQALNALRLEAPHIHVMKKIAEVVDEWSQDWSDDEGFSDENSDLAQEEGPEDSRSFRKKKEELDMKCLDCNNRLCRRVSVKEPPKLMLLGSGELGAFSCP